MAAKNSKEAKQLLEQIPEPLAKQVFQHLKERYEGNRRSQAVKKEDLVGASGEIFLVFEAREFNVAQQKTTLRYCLDMLQRATDKWKNPKRSKSVR